MHTRAWRGIQPPEREVKKHENASNANSKSENTWRVSKKTHSSIVEVIELNMSERCKLKHTLRLPPLQYKKQHQIKNGFYLLNAKRYVESRQHTKQARNIETTMVNKTEIWKERQKTEPCVCCVHVESKKGSNIKLWKKTKRANNTPNTIPHTKYKNHSNSYYVRARKREANIIQSTI